MDLTNESTLKDLVEIVDYLKQEYPLDTPISLTMNGGSYNFLTVLEPSKDEEDKSICFYPD